MELVSDACWTGRGGFFAFFLHQQKGWGRTTFKRSPGPSAVGRLQSALGLRPRRALSSAEAKGQWWRGRGVFPVSVSLGVYRAGNGKRGLELVARGVAHDFSAGREFSQ